ncbi:WD40 repeat-like protein [Suillus brevipes Sb2]|nr:WD40 repeat-like protein [Suillus brevipes Sb2]
MQGHMESVDAAAFFSDGRRVVTGSWDHTLQIWDVQEGLTSVGGPLWGHNNRVLSVAVSPDDRRIASGGVDKTIIIWDVESKQKVFSPLVKHTDWVWSVCFSPDGKMLASGSSDRTVVIWNAENGTVLDTTTSSSQYGVERRIQPRWAKISLRIIGLVVWAPDGTQLVSASYDNTVKFWNSSNTGGNDQFARGSKADPSVIPDKLGSP